jgi:drug/metabolite transporter (DMT)-like permease
MTSPPSPQHQSLTAKLSTPTALLLFATVVLVWGLNWTVTKIIVAHVTPLWTASIRTMIAVVALLMLLAARRQLILPRRGDIPVVLAIGLFHMVAFSALMTAGLKYVPVGRSIVLGYTVPLWVAPGAWLFLREPMPGMRILGIVLGLCGLAVMFNPLEFDWNDSQAVFGNGLLLLSAFAWSISILYVRAHRWISTPFQLVFWEALLAAVLLTAMAVCFEGRPHIVWTTELTLSFAYSGLIGTALGFWAMAVVNRSVPAAITSLGILATPVVGIATSVLLLGETLTLPLILATALILSGIAIGTIAGTAMKGPPWKLRWRKHRGE